VPIRYSPTWATAPPRCARPCTCWTTPDIAKLNTELAFPCVWISPWSRSDGIEPLRHSLVLNAITTDEDLIDDLVNEADRDQVYRGHHRTYYTTPTTPHDGYVADFLMRNKGFIRTDVNQHDAKPADRPKRQAGT